MNFFRHKSKGISGIVVGLLLASSLMVGLVAGGIKYLSAVHVGTAAAKTDAQVLYVAQSKMELAKAIDYDKLDLAAESRTAYADTGFETEVSIGDEVEIDENTKKRDITVKVYKPSGTVPLFKLTYLKPLTAQVSGNLEMAIINVGTISLNSRLTFSNPFPGYYVQCFVELYSGGQWYYPEYVLGGSGDFRGTTVSQLLPSGNIALVAGNSNIANGNANILGVSANSASCRIRVIRLAKIN
nr:hypothetical protein SPSPH_45330 [Sporomusa sphaeroides DSM 2875]